MAVTKIRKISSLTLLLSMIISVVVLVMFFTGGVVDPSAEMIEYNNTDMLINWVYVLFGLTIAGTVIFALIQFISELTTDFKGALMSVASIIAFAVILFIGYSMGDGTPLEGLNAEAQVYNTESWLKITDMWIYSTYILLGLIVSVVVLGSIKKIIGK